MLPNPPETFIREDERRRGSRTRCKSGHIWPTNWNINLGILIYSVVKQIYVVLSAHGASNISNQLAFRSNIRRNECNNKEQIRGCSELLLHIITMDAADVNHVSFCFWLLVFFSSRAMGRVEKMVRLKWTFWIIATWRLAHDLFSVGGQKKPWGQLSWARIEDWGQI